MWAYRPHPRRPSNASRTRCRVPRMSERAARYLDDHFEDFLATLVALSKIPSVSAEPFPKAEVRRSAEAVKQAMADVGLTNTQLLELPDAHPYAYGEWLGAPGKPTLLLYAH